MKLFRLSRFSIKTRLSISMGIILLPLVLLGGSALFFLRSDNAVLGKVVEEAVGEIHPVIHLQTLILNAAMPPNDYLITGDPAEREAFARLSRELEQVIEEMLDASFALKVEREFIFASREEWRLAKGIALSLLSIPDPVANQAAAREMKRMDVHFRKAVELLEQIHQFAHEEVEEGVVHARAFHRQALILFTLFFIMGAGFSVVLGLVLTRSILGPLRILEKGAEQLGSGNLSHRVILDNDDELAQVAKTFNRMADSLEKSEETLKNLSVRDGLTGLYNHQEFQRRLKEEMERSLRYGRPLSLLMLDIDHFKRVNDTRGHPAGDRVLQGVASRIRDHIRPTDQFARYGGEEFAVILPETPVSGALAAAERIRGAIADLAIPLDQEDPVEITVSIGMATFQEDVGSAQELIVAADRALYAAKQAGRNCIRGLSGGRETKKEGS
jgi:diguanylate cyclase (GGDEF)-like protein